MQHEAVLAPIGSSSRRRSAPLLSLFTIVVAANAHVMRRLDLSVGVHCSNKQRGANAESERDFYTLS